MALRSVPRVVIIGGGIIGVSAAYYARKIGAEVTLLDMGEIGRACSHGNAGYVAPSHFVPLAHPGVITQGLKWMLDPDSPFYIRPRFDPDLFAWIRIFRRMSTDAHVRASMHILRDLAQATLGLFEEIAQSENLAFELQQKGLLMLYNSEKGRRSNLKEVDLAGELNVKTAVLDRSGLGTLDPGMEFRCLGGVYWPGDAHIAPASFMEVMGNQLETMGVTVRSSTPVLGFSLSGKEVRGVEIPGGVVEGDEFVLAGGSWSSSLVKRLGIRLPLQPGKGYSVTVEKPTITPILPMILSEARVAITPFADSLRFGGTMELAGLDLSVTRSRVNAILRAVPRYLANVDTSGVRREGAWSGLRPVSPDGLPYIGRFREIPNLIAATGHAMLGVTLATGTGKLVAQIIARDRPFLPLAQFQPDRFS